MNLSRRFAEIESLIAEVRRIMSKQILREKPKKPRTGDGDEAADLRDVLKKAKAAAKKNGKK